MKYIVICSIALLHLVYLVGNSFTHTITSYFEFYRVLDRSKGFTYVLDKYQSGFSKFNGLTPVQIYGKYSGFDMGYGFFAPNVLSSGDMVFEYKHKRLLPEVNSYEGNVRFSSVISRFIGHMVIPKEEKDTTAVDPRYNKPEYKIKFEKVCDIEDQYYELVLKNIAAKVYAQYNCNDTMKVKLYIYDFPSLASYRDNKAARDHRHNFLCIKQNDIFIKKH
jgi:hypothetical protein